MPGVAVEFHSAAAEELAAAENWYRERSEAAASAFVAELDRAIACIGGAPETWAEHVRGTRRFVLRRFPFSIIYQTGSSTAKIVAVAHARRLPGYWMER
jgi:plasmid stabilization system protein ParE